MEELDYEMRRLLERAQANIREDRARDTANRDLKNSR
jgi:hypothetical protein